VHIPFIEDKNTIVKELHNPDKKNVGQVTNINWFSYLSFFIRLAVHLIHFRVAGQATRNNKGT